MTRKWLKVLSLALLISVVSISLFAGELSYTVNMPTVTFGESNNYVTMSVKGYFNLNIPGYPSIPYYPVKFLLPPSAKVDRVWIDNVKTDSKGIYGKVFPSQKPIPLMRGYKHKFTEPIKSVYENDKPYPSYTIKSAGISKLSGFRILQINAYPVQYLPLSNKIVRKSFTVHVSYTIGKVPVKTISKLQFKHASEEVKNIVTNPSMISQYEPVVRR